MNSKLANLQRRHPKFSYQSFAYNLVAQNLEINFVFKIEPDLIFRPKIIIYKVSQKQLDILGQNLDNFVFNLGMSEIPSYWKATCSPLIQVDCGYLDQQQINFWHKLFIKGMAQFFYENQIDFTQESFVQIKSNSAKNYAFNLKKLNLLKSLKQPRYLVPLGGGKDSIVALEILKKAGTQLNTFFGKTNQAATELTKLAGFTKPIVYNRFIDKNLLTLNQKGYLNGHVPITAFNSFLSLLAAAIFSFNQVVFANESSAEEENLVWKGVKINHQYSKSLEFENDFRAYCQKYLTKNINYFSFLRPLSELQITNLFTHYPKYFKIFRSCNAGHKTNAWCCNCPKCLSVFLHLSPFLTASTLSTIFGQDLFKDIKLLPILKQLLGAAGYKPFECVGTIDENRAAAFLTLRRFSEGELPPLLVFAQKYLQSFHYTRECERPKYNDFHYNQKKAELVLKAWNKNHHVPKKLLSYLT